MTFFFIKDLVILVADDSVVVGGPHTTLCVRAGLGLDVQHDAEHQGVGDDVEGEDGGQAEDNDEGLGGHVDNDQTAQHQDT